MLVTVRTFARYKAHQHLKKDFQCFMRCRIIVSRNIFMQIDHIVPLAIGGSNDDENFQILSSNCRTKETTEENKLDV